MELFTDVELDECFEGMEISTLEETLDTLEEMKLEALKFGMRLEVRES